MQRRPKSKPRRPSTSRKPEQLQMLRPLPGTTRLTTPQANTELVRWTCHAKSRPSSWWTSMSWTQSSRIRTYGFEAGFTQAELKVTTEFNRKKIKNLDCFTSKTGIFKRSFRNSKPFIYINANDKLTRQVAFVLGCVLIFANDQALGSWQNLHKAATQYRESFLDTKMLDFNSGSWNFRQAMLLCAPSTTLHGPMHRLCVRVCQ